MYYDNDDCSPEIMIQHQSLKAVEAFAVERDEVRRIPCAVVERKADLERTELPTMIPTASGVVAAEEVPRARSVGEAPTMPAASGVVVTPAKVVAA